MSERRRPARRGRGRPPVRPSEDLFDEADPYRDSPAEAATESPGGDDTAEGAERTERAPRPRRTRRTAKADQASPASDSESSPARPSDVATAAEAAPPLPPAPSPAADGSTTPYAGPNGFGGPGGPGTAPEERGERGERRQRPDRFERGRGDRQRHHEHRGERQDRGDRADRGDRGDRGDREWNGRRGRRNRGRGGGGGGGGQQFNQQRRDFNQQPQAPITVTGDARGWFDAGREGGFIRKPETSYLAESGDPFVPANVVRQFGLRRGDLLEAGVGRDHRGRLVVAEVRTINGVEPAAAAGRPEFQSLQASYPDRKLTLETGRPARGAELTRRAIDLIAPIGYGQRALIVAPARAGKTTLLHAITEGVATNHPDAVLLILLVDERPEEVSEAQSWGVGEVISSSFDQPAQRHVEVTEIVLERARRLVELGKDVVIVLDSLTRMARAHNTAERGTGRTLSGGLDAQAMAKPKAFFGSARAVAPAAGGGSLTIIATALVETGSRMDDVIFEEFKGTGNCEIKLDRSLAEKRVFPAIDIATSGTRREEKLFRPEQLDAVYALRRGLSQMPPQAAMEWLIKRIAATPSNDALLAGLIRD